jgi:hypothetical protein
MNVELLGMKNIFEIKTQQIVLANNIISNEKLFRNFQNFSPERQNVENC